MAGIKAKQVAEIRDALAIILRASFDTKRERRIENTARQVGKIDKLLPNVKFRGEKHG